jgi:hypothetical protein
VNGFIAEFCADQFDFGEVSRCRSRVRIRYEAGVGPDIAAQNSSRENSGGAGALVRPVGVFS